jgi:hypothetical protein
MKELLAKLWVSINQSDSKDISIFNILKRLSESSEVEKIVIPSKTNEEIYAIVSPSTGLMFIDKDINKIVFYNGTGWETIVSEVQ